MLAQPCGLLPSGVLITIAEMQNEVPLRYLVFYTRYSIQSVDAHFSGLFAQASDAVAGIGVGAEEFGQGFAGAFEGIDDVHVLSLIHI